MQKQECFEYKQIAKIINSKRYTQKQFNQNYNKMSQLIDSINQMDIVEEAFKIIRILIRFFRFPILILFRPFFERLEKEKEELMKYIQQLKSIGGIVIKILEDKDFPSLQFYTRAGYMKGANLQPKNEEKTLKEFFLSFDNVLNQIVGDNPKMSSDKLKFWLNALSQLRSNNEFDPIFELCCESFKSLAMNKLKQIENSHQPRVEKIQNISGRVPQKIEIQQGNTIKYINDIRVAEDYLCCRPYFYFNEIINEPQTITQQYKNYKYPYNKMLDQIFLKTIAGFLNGKGGIIYIGIRQNVNSKKRTVVGQVYNESLKEEVLKHFRYLGQRISPQIVNNQLYKLQFVPLKNQNTFLPGQYIIRLRISKGQKGELYSFKNYDCFEYVAFRTENQVLVRRLSQEILELYRKKLTQPEDLQYSNHVGPCKRPQTGKPSYQHSKSSYQPDNKWIKKPSAPVYKQKQFINNRIAYYFIGRKVHQGLKKYYHQDYTKIPVIEPDDASSNETVRKTIESLQNKNEYILVSLRITFLEEYFQIIWDILQGKVILTTTQKSSRKKLIFNSIKQALYAAKALEDMKIPFNFQVPKL